MTNDTHQVFKDDSLLDAIVEGDDAKADEIIDRAKQGETIRIM